MTAETTPMVGIVVVSHSAELARATVELATRLANLAPDGPRLVSAGGMEDGSLGTDAVRVADAIGQADAGRGVLILADLGSAVLSAVTAIDELVAPEQAERVRISNGPLVEGCFIAAVQASAGDDLAAVAAAADAAGSMDKVGDRS